MFPSFALQSVFPYPPEQTPIVALPQIILPHSPLSLKQQPGRRPFHERKAPSSRVHHNPILLDQPEQLADAQTPCTAPVELGKHLIEETWSKAPVRVEDTRVRAVFRLVDTVDVDAEERIGQIAVPEAGRVREEKRDQEGADGEGDGKSELAEAGVDIVRMDDIVIITVPEENVLLKGSGVLVVEIAVSSISGCSVGPGVVVVVHGVWFGDVIVFGVSVICDGGLVGIFALH